MCPVLCISKEISGGTKVPSLQEGFLAVECSVRVVALPGNTWRCGKLGKVSGRFVLNLFKQKGTFSPIKHLVKWGMLRCVKSSHVLIVVLFDLKAEQLWYNTNMYLLQSEELQRSALDSSCSAFYCHMFHVQPVSGVFKTSLIWIFSHTSCVRGRCQIQRSI